MVRYKQKLIDITLTFIADKLCASFFIASKLPTSSQIPRKSQKLCSCIVNHLRIEIEVLQFSDYIEPNPAANGTRSQPWSEQEFNTFLKAWEEGWLQVNWF